MHEFFDIFVYYLLLCFEGLWMFGGCINMYVYPQIFENKPKCHFEECISKIFEIRVSMISAVYYYFWWYNNENMKSPKYPFTEIMVCRFNAMVFSDQMQDNPTIVNINQHNENWSG